MTPGKARYGVAVEFTPGVYTDILATDDWQRAADTANFWDERVNVRFTDRSAMTPAQVADERLRDLAVDVDARIVAAFSGIDRECARASRRMDRAECAAAMDSSFTRWYDRG